MHTELNISTTAIIIAMAIYDSTMFHRLLLGTTSVNEIVSTSFLCVKSLVKHGQRDKLMRKKTW